MALPFIRISADIHNYSDLFVLIFSHHRGTEVAETQFLFTHRGTRPPCLSESDGGQAAMSKKSAPLVIPTLLIGMKIFVMRQH